MSQPSTVQICWRLLRNDPVAYALSWLQWVAFHLSPLAVGWAVKLVLDRLSEDTSGVPWSLIGVVIGLELARWTLLVSAAVQWHGAWVGWQTVPRVNLLESLSTGGGPVAGRLPGSPGEAVSRFRDDVQDVALVLDIWLDISGALVSAGLAIAVMAAIEPLAAVAVVIPVTIALAVSVAFGPKLRTWRRDAREATAAVTSFIGDTFGSILAIKTGGAELAAGKRFTELNDRRARVALKDAVGSELIRTLGYGTGEVTVGVVLVMVAASLRNDELSVGDIALFASYVTVIAGVAKWAGRMAIYHRQADVSTDRLAELTTDRSRPPVVRRVQTHLRHGPPLLTPLELETEPLQTVEIEDLTVIHTGGHVGVTEASLRVSAGELVVVTGQVGSGKTSLLRGVLGLVPVASGTVRWNGSVVDPATWMVPPRVSYLPQVPRLFSESVSETVLLGLGDSELDRAIWLACMEEDVARMENGVATIVGPKGVRLSGGQVQRTAAARAFVRKPQLLVVDDLSSALDVDTELEMWRRLRSSSPTAALIVSHRTNILAMADRIVRLGEGRMVNTDR